MNQGNALPPPPPKKKSGQGVKDSKNSWGLKIEWVEQVGGGGAIAQTYSRHG